MEVFISHAEIEQLQTRRNKLIFYKGFIVTEEKSVCYHIEQL